MRDGKERNKQRQAGRHLDRRAGREELIIWVPKDTDGIVSEGLFRNHSEASHNDII